MLLVHLLLTCSLMILARPQKTRLLTQLAHHKKKTIPLIMLVNSKKTRLMIMLVHSKKTRPVIMRAHLLELFLYIFASLICCCLHQQAHL